MAEAASMNNRIAFQPGGLGYLVGGVAFKTHLHQLPVFVLQLCHQVSDKSAPFGLGGSVVVGKLRQVVLHVTGFAAVAQHMACLPLNPCLFFVGHGILPQVADVQPQAYRHVLKQVTASLVVAVR